MPETVDEIEAKAAPGTRGINWTDMQRLRVDQQGRLVWMGDLVQVQRKLTLSAWQAAFAGAAAMGALSQGVLAFYDLGTRLGWWGAPR